MSYVMIVLGSFIGALCSSAALITQEWVITTCIYLFCMLVMCGIVFFFDLRAKFKDAGLIISSMKDIWAYIRRK